jgi:hypothetical protein
MGSPAEEAEAAAITTLRGGEGRGSGKRDGKAKGERHSDNGGEAA